MQKLLLYANPLILNVAFLGYLSPFFLTITPGGVSGNLVAWAILLFVASVVLAWIAALVQLVLGIRELRAGKPAAKHHLISVVWTVVLYVVIFTALSNGYILTA